MHKGSKRDGKKKENSRFSIRGPASTGEVEKGFRGKGPKGRGGGTKRKECAAQGGPLFGKGIDHENRKQTTTKPIR